MLFIIIVYVIALTAAGPIRNNDTNNNANKTLLRTRRILQGHSVGDTKPYMVYLRPTPSTDPQNTASDWLCGGVIIHVRFILTSAACIEDAKNFYVIAGTNKWTPATEKNDECVKNGAKKAVWKCVPKSYVFDGNDFDNMRWMIGDIAVVKVEDDFNFERRIVGCDFIPKKVGYNNISADITKPSLLGSIAGWGSNSSYSDWMEEPSVRSNAIVPELQEAEVQLISNDNCKKRWEPRYHFVIDEHMICTKDVNEATNVCADHDVECKELQTGDNDEYQDQVDDKTFRRQAVKPSHFHETRRTKNSGFTIGGFCENDHGGPLIIGHGRTAMVVGIMSACLTKGNSKKCHGPFLFTSVYRYQHMITCALDKDHEESCRRLLRTSTSSIAETHFDWSKHPDGPAKGQELLRMPQNKPENATKVSTGKITTVKKGLVTTKKPK